MVTDVYLFINDDDNDDTVDEEDKMTMMTFQESHQPPLSAHLPQFHPSLQDQGTIIP